MYTALLAIYTAQEMARALLVFVEREIDVSRRRQRSLRARGLTSMLFSFFLMQGFENSPITWAISLFIGFIVSRRCSFSHLYFKSLTLFFLPLSFNLQFGMALLPFGLYHLYLILKNRTTIESMEGSGRVRIASKSHSNSNHNNSPNEPDQPRMSIEDRLKGLTSTSSSTQTQRRKQTWKPDESLTKSERKLLKKANKLNIYNVGAFKNWKFVMGDNWIYWFFPIGKPDCDGIEYEINEETLVELRRITEEVRGGVESREEEERNGLNHQRDDYDDSNSNWNRSRISSTRSSTRSSNQSSSRAHERDYSDRTGQNQFSKVDVDLGRRPEPEFRRKGSKFKSAHGEVMEWGEPPKRDFVLFGVDSDEDEDLNGKGKGNSNGEQDLKVEDPWT